MNTIYSQISSHTIPEEIVQQIKSLIKDGKLQPGEKLPPERALADLLGVGRSSLREAINILETLGFVEVKKREGIFISTVSSTIMFDPIKQILEEDRGKLYELYELRKDIELASIYMAAKLRSKEDLVRIEKPLIRMIEDSKESHFSLSDDVEFHLAVAQATHNWLRVHILKNILDLVADYMDLIVQKLIEEKTGVFIVLDQHKKIYQAIQKRNQESARVLMNEHLTWVEEKWKEFGRKKK
ncbi:MAG: FadR family transcriptional regulator [Deltaproteobacteria bacterium]|nr:FadR family transcriptional regulator [Deltaproteobacteria bacterium]MBW2106545.1 FadR family transcriptional regulator [Deltaproteobacteria bacterium]